MEHDHIGVMDGPLILGPKDGAEVSPLWDLSFAFQESVRLAIAPDFIPHKLIDDTVTEQGHAEPYSMDLAHMQPEKELDEKEDLEDYIDILVRDEKVMKKRIRFLQWPSVPTFAPRAKLHQATIKMASIATYISAWRKALWKSTGRFDDEDWSHEDIGESEWDYRSRRIANTVFNGTEEFPRVAKIIAYAPQTFHDLRSRFGVSENEFIDSILSSGPFVSFQSNSKGAARSGGFFFFTMDGSYMIKTIKKGEVGAFLDMLPKYHKYMRRNGRKTLLTRVFGMYSVEMDDQKTKSRGIIDEVKEKLMPHKSDERVFVIMNSVFPAEGSKFISERYDLKGSTVGRECSEEEKQRKGSNAVLKDLDLAKEVELVRSLERPRMRSSYGINIGPVAKSSLLSQLRKDVKLLMECNVMDYSLLVGVVDMDSGNLDAASLKAFEKSELYESRMRQLTRKKKNMGRVILSSITTPLRILAAPATFFARQMWEKAETTLSTILTLPLPYYGAGICGIDGGSLSKLKGTRNGKRAMYYIGVIDFLQPWTASKVVERQLKGFMGYDTRAISCVTPEEYAARFLVFMDSHVS